MNAACRRLFSVAPALVGASILWIAPAAAQSEVTLPAGVQRVTSVEGITEYRLDNGLPVLLFPDPTKTTVTVNITYLVGSKHENYGETGMAHLLEHLLFRKSTNHPEIKKELQDHGTSPNGSTWYDRTNYFETFEASDENLEWALDLESDRMIHSTISREELDAEMTVVRNEFERGENSPINVLYDRVVSTAYLWHNYGKSTIGARSDIENVDIPRLQAFYQRYYQPDNAVLVVAGRLDEGKTLNLIAERFGQIPRPSRTLPDLYTSEPTQDGERSVVLRRVGDTQAIIVGYHTPPGSHPDFSPLQLATQILGANQPSGRLYQALVETQKAAGVSSSELQLEDAGMTLLLAQVRTEASVDEARDTLLATVDAIRTNPFTSEELERTRNRLLSGFDLQFNNSERVALGLSEWASMGDWRLLFLDRDRIRAATLADVQRTAEYYLTPSNRTVGLFIPTEEQPARAEVPAAPDLVALLEGYTGDEARSAGEVFDTSPQNVEARTRRLTLPGGLQLALLPKETRGDTVSATLRLNFGSEDSLRGSVATGEMAGQMLMRGTTEHSRQEIRDELDRLKARMFVGGGPTGVSVTIETVRENLPAVLALAIEVLRQPAFPPAELETLRQESLAQLEESRTEPEAIVARAFRRHLVGDVPADDIRYIPTVDEELAAIRGMTVDQLRGFHTRFFGTSAAEGAIVGDFDPEAVLNMLTTGLDGWQSQEAYAEINTPFRPKEPVNEVFETPDKANAVFIAGIPMQMRDDDPDYPALVLANSIIGEGIGSRLLLRIREREGLSYGVGSSLSVPSDDDTATFIGNAISAPENTTQVEASFTDEMATILRDGFSETEIAEAKTAWLQGRQISRGRDGTLAGRLSSQLHDGRTMAWDAELEQKVQALTAEQITAAMRRHWDLSKLIVMKGGDFAGAGAQ